VVYWAEVVTTAENEAREQRSAKATVFSCTVPLAFSPSKAADIMQNTLSDVIQRVEQHGWALDRVSSVTRNEIYSAALLIFRPAP
jgi:hypothetical protein